MQLFEIDHLLDEPEEMALCPLCSGVICEGELVAIGKASGVLSLIHEMCFVEPE